MIASPYDSMIMQDADWIAPAEVARILNVPQRIIYVLINEGKLTAMRWPVTVRRSDLDSCVRTCRIKPGDRLT